MADDQAPKVDPEPDKVPTGHLWEIEARANVNVTRPDGQRVTVAPIGGTAGHYLNVAGTYTAETASGKIVSVTAVD